MLGKQIYSWRKYNTMYSYKSDLFPSFQRWEKYSLKWFSKMNLSISVIFLPLGSRESWFKTSRIFSVDHDEIVCRKAALIHPKLMKASIKWVIGGNEVSRKLWMSRYWLGSCVVQVISGSMFIEGSFDRGRIWEADLGATSWVATSHCWVIFDWDRRIECSCMTKRVAKYSFFLLSSPPNKSGYSSLSCEMCGNEFIIL